MQEICLARMLYVLAVVRPPDLQVLVRVIVSVAELPNSTYTVIHMIMSLFLCLHD